MKSPNEGIPQIAIDKWFGVCHRKVPCVLRDAGLDDEQHNLAVYVREKIPHINQGQGGGGVAAEPCVKRRE